MRSDGPNVALSLIADILKHAATLLRIGSFSSASVLSELRQAAVALERAVVLSERRKTPRDGSHDGRVARDAALTPRDREVVRLLLQNRSYKEVAHELGISFLTVQTKVKAIYAKLHVHSRAELAQALSTNTSTSTITGTASGSSGHTQRIRSPAV